ncbi:unnamed protein product [Enterobius vermicularis]|uniref:Conserved domain protein n=1 Tax=Enterobius vermicularis TaxID=51028 RepID=A0A0N4V208_ENTVE|nr:unnamed protein product [Enterobius vermicularis]
MDKSVTRARFAALIFNPRIFEIILKNSIAEFTIMGDNGERLMTTNGSNGSFPEKLREESKGLVTAKEGNILFSCGRKGVFSSGKGRI